MSEQNNQHEPHCAGCYAAGKRDGAAAERANIASLEAQIAELDDMLICSWITPAGTVKEKVHLLIGWEVMIALDPSVSEKARALVEAERARCAKIAKHGYNWKDILRAIEQEPKVGEIENEPK